MKNLISLAALALIVSACDRNVIRPKGSDREWQQRQEEVRVLEQQQQLERQQENPRELQGYDAN